jgi:two-component system sensor histidine kinase TrcS
VGLRESSNHDGNVGYARSQRPKRQAILGRLPRISNAWVHTPPGVTVTTGITCHYSDPTGPYAELTVIDDGPDIDPDVLPRLFERFVRADKSRSDGAGHGLGLAIVNSIVRAHGGSVAAESANGRTVFRVRLPMIEQPVPDNA